jgi:hypothetical protein
MSLGTRHRYLLRWASRFLLLSAILTAILLLTACSTAWTGEASNIIKVLIPAVEALLGLIAGLGAKIPADAVTTIESWASQAQQGLTQIAELIDQYNTAEADAKPGLLIEIQTAAETIVNNLSQLLPTLHITDPASQSKVTSIANAILSELQALVNVIPALQGKIHLHELKAMPLDAGHFKQKFNATMTEPTGDPQVDEVAAQNTI